MMLTKICSKFKTTNERLIESPLLQISYKIRPYILLQIYNL